MSRRERQQLDELACLLEPPRPVLDVYAIDDDGEPTEKRHPDSEHAASMIDLSPQRKSIMPYVQGVTSRG
jgi:hypothetical protein